ncbi:hypothetical protein CCP3SC5AM1_520002 [Gammaproteobacteria bacterium]
MPAADSCLARATKSSFDSGSTGRSWSFAFEPRSFKSSATISNVKTKVPANLVHNPTGAGAATPSVGVTRMGGFRDVGSGVVLGFFSIVVSGCGEVTIGAADDAGFSGVVGCAVEECTASKAGDSPAVVCVSTDGVTLVSGFAKISSVEVCVMFLACGISGLA